MIKDNLTAIIFSKNRPLQLFALLESMFANSDMDQECVNVLYKADHDYVWPMEQVKQSFPCVTYHTEYDFRAQTLHLIANAKNHVVFFTDDDVFKDKTDLKNACEMLNVNPQIIAFSLRLGKHLDYCHSTQSKQAVPFGSVNHGIFTWTWKRTDWDWNYVVSVDGHIFRKTEIQELIKHAGDWKSPNSLEGNLSHLMPNINHPWMACYETSKVFNIPVNQVQTEVNNVNAGGTQQELLVHWNNGKKIDISTFQGIQNKSAHQVVSLSLIDRT